MKFFVVLAALFATVVIASPTDSTAAAPADESASPAGHKVAADGPAPDGCYWSGTAPFCAGGCPADYTEMTRGGCGDGACCVTGEKVLCCK
jgi:hypothetical protein